MIWLRRITVFTVAVFVLAVVIATFKHHLWPWIEVHTGTVNESGPYYGFWSGFGSDLGEATIVAGIIAAYRHHNCHVKRCPRLGQPVDGGPYLACPRHHPAHEGTKRGVSVETIHTAHANHRKPGISADDALTIMRAAAGSAERTGQQIAEAYAPVAKVLAKKVPTKKKATKKVAPRKTPAKKAQ